MKNKLFLIASLLFIGMSINAQETFYKSYSWDAKPDFSKFKIDTLESVISFKDKTVTEFAYEGESFLEFYLQHKIIWLNADDKIEDYNKVYLPYNIASKLLINKARVVTKEGKVIELDESKIHTATDEETKRSYKYFAFEGLEKGSFIEYYYVEKRNPKYKGVRKTLQDDFVKYNTEFEVYSPKHLVFEFKSYNELGEVKRDTLVKDRLHWKLTVPNLAKLETEKMAANVAMKKYLIYKLDRNTANKVYDISSYGNVSKNVYSFLYKEFSKSELKLLKKFLKKTELAKEETDEGKIRKLENYIKSNFYISKQSSNELEDIATMLKENAASASGLMKLFIAATRLVNIKTEVVLTSDRFISKFDEDFEANYFLDEFLLYFPSVKKYTAIDKLEARLGYPPTRLSDNYGLFVKEVRLGEYKNGVGKVKYIKPNKASDNANNMLINVVFDDEDITNLKIKFNHLYAGYTARFIHPYISKGNPEKIDEMYDRMIKSVNEGLEIKSKKILNSDSELFGVKPLTLISETETSALVTKAGRKYLFKVGELIGPQSQMYQEKKRVLPIEMDYQRLYEREINITIPDGFTVKNLEDITIDNVIAVDGVNLYGFQSNYKLNGNQLKINIDEYYNSNKVPLSQYEDYRKIINSAADFNKIVLLLEKI